MIIKRTLLFLTLVLCFLLLSCQSDPPDPTQPSPPAPSGALTPVPTLTPSPSPTPPPSPDDTLSVEETYTREQFDHTDGQTLCTLRVAVPDIVGRGDAARALQSYYDSVDLMLASLWDEYVAEANAKYESSKISGGLFMPVDIEGNFSVEGYTDRFLSVRRELYIYSGGVHGGTTLYTETFDLQTGRVLSLQDLFTVGLADMQQRLLPYVLDAVQAHPDDYFENYASLAVDLFPYDCFTLNEDTLTLIYPEYSLAAFTQGTLSFPIPLADLADILNTAYIP